MGFRTTLRKIAEVEPAPGDEHAAKRIAVIRKVLEQPVVVATMHDNYTALGAARKLCDAPMLRVVQRAARPGPCTLETGEATLLFAHATRCISLHQNHADADVKRWAEMSALIQGMSKDDATPSACEVIGNLADSDPHLQRVFCGVLHWMIAECNRVGATCMPYRAPSV